MRRVVKVSRIRIIITIIVVVLTTLLTGCTGKEPNEIAYVVALGIDSTDDDNYKITIQYANTTQISGGASESGGKAGSEIVDNVTIEAPNIYAGVGLANNIVSKSFSMSHAKLIVFSKEVAEKGVKDMIETLVRSEEIRPDVFIAVANTTANDYLTSVNPEMEVNPAQYYQLIYQKNQLVGIPDGQLREFFTGLYTDNYDSILPVAGVMWKPLPSLAVSAECWIKAGGAHHSVLSYDVTAEMMKDWAEMMGIEFLHIGENTTVEDFEKEIFWNDIAYKLK